MNHHDPRPGRREGDTRPIDYIACEDRTQHDGHVISETDAGRDICPGYPWPTNARNVPPPPPAHEPADLSEMEDELAKPHTHPDGFTYRFVREAGRCLPQASGSDAPEDDTPLRFGADTPERGTLPIAPCDVYEPHGRHPYGVGDPGTEAAATPAWWCPGVTPFVPGRDELHRFGLVPDNLESALRVARRAVADLVTAVDVLERGLADLRAEVSRDGKG
jgi:hypothetical protein